MMTMLRVLLYKVLLAITSEEVSQILETWSLVWTIPKNTTNLRNATTASLKTIMFCEDTPQYTLAIQ
jgi:hypothetical protein